MKALEIAGEVGDVFIADFGGDGFGTETAAEQFDGMVLAEIVQPNSRRPSRMGAGQPFEGSRGNAEGPGEMADLVARGVSADGRNGQGTGLRRAEDRPVSAVSDERWSCFLQPAIVRHFLLPVTPSLEEKWRVQKPESRQVFYRCWSYNLGWFGLKEGRISRNQRQAGLGERGQGFLDCSYRQEQFELIGWQRDKSELLVIAFGFLVFRIHEKTNAAGRVENLNEFPHRGDQQSFSDTLPLILRGDRQAPQPDAGDVAR